MNKFKKFSFFFIFLPILLFGLAAEATAQLVAGPINPANGFPRTIQSPGLTPAAPPMVVRLCLVNAFCSNDPPIPGNAFSERVGFGREVFYWRATADIGRVATLEMGVATRWAGGVVANRRQRVVNFIRVDLRNLPSGGTYRVLHPFGAETFNVVADAQGRFNVDFIRSAGLGQPSPVTKFLKAANAPAGFLGDSNTPSRVTGSPIRRNFFRVIGPAGVDLGGTVQPNVVATSLFTVEGTLR
ncbi:MAG: hypothetical protein AAGU11_02040 [Syntrophobacteraceae bacterium]